MTTTAQSVALRAVGLLQDTTSIRWPAAELVRWMNDAQRDIIMMRPDALVITGTMTLASGTRQDLDAAGLTPTPQKLIEVTRNMAATSTKKAVRQCQRNILDANTPGWHTLTASVNILHFMFDERDPTAFYVYPPATIAAQLEVTYGAYPTSVTEPADGALYTDITGNIGVSDIYANAVLDYMLYRAYDKDASYTSNAARSAKHFSAFAAAIGMESKATSDVSPKVVDNMTTGG